jgi:hypothetical protein
MYVEGRASVFGLDYCSDPPFEADVNDVPRHRNGFSMTQPKQRVSRFLIAAATLATSVTPAAAQTPAQPSGGTAWHMPPMGSASQQPSYGTPPYTQPQNGYVQPQPAPNAYGQRYGYQGYYYPNPQQYPQQPPQPEQPVEPEPEEPSPPFFDIMVGTQLPLSLGADLSIELPFRILLQGGIGWMPPAYGSIIGGMMEGFGAYDTTVAAIVEDGFEDALVGRVSGGWRPFPDHGFEIIAGYTHVRVSGKVTPETVAAVAGGELGAAVEAQQLTQDIELTSALHNFHVGLGWRWVILEHLVIRATLGYTQTVGSSSSVEVPERPDLGTLATPTVDAELNDVYTTYAKLPLFGLSAGYRF